MGKNIVCCPSVVGKGRFIARYQDILYTRECKGQIVDFSISGLRLSLFLGGGSPLPQEIVLDNGPEMTSKAMFLFSEQAGVRLRFIDPGKPMQMPLSKVSTPGSGTPVSTSIGSPVWQTLGRRMNLGASITIASGLTVLYSTEPRRRCATNGKRRELGPPDLRSLSFSRFLSRLFQNGRYRYQIYWNRRKSNHIRNLIHSKGSSSHPMTFI